MQLKTISDSYVTGITHVLCYRACYDVVVVFYFYICYLNSS